MPRAEAASSRRCARPIPKRRWWWSGSPPISAAGCRFCSTSASAICTRYNPKTLEIRYRGKNIAEVLALTVEGAWDFFADAPTVCKSLKALREVGLDYLRLGQPATEFSGGEAQRVKLATELQRAQRGGALYVLDEPTTGLYPTDVERLLGQLQALVDSGNSVIPVDHDMELAAASDWVIDIGPGAGDDGGRIVAAGPPAKVASSRASRTAPYLRRALEEEAVATAA